MTARGIVALGGGAWGCADCGARVSASCRCCEPDPHTCGRILPVWVRVVRGERAGLWCWEALRGGVPIDFGPLPKVRGVLARARAAVAAAEAAGLGPVPLPDEGVPL